MTSYRLQKKKKTSDLKIPKITQGHSKNQFPVFFALGLSTPHKMSFSISPSLPTDFLISFKKTPVHFYY